MGMTDPIADYLTRIRNALRAGHRRVDIPASRLKREITRVLFERRFIKNYVLLEDDRQGLIRIYLKYGKDAKSVVSGLRRISKPGLRQYVGTKNLPRVYNNLGIAIMTTPLGVMTNLEAHVRHVGGEVLCHVW